MSDNDTLQRFLFEHTPIRGEIVHLDATWQAILSKHDYLKRLAEIDNIAGVKEVIRKVSGTNPEPPGKIGFFRQRIFVLPPF